MYHKLLISLSVISIIYISFYTPEGNAHSWYTHSYLKLTIETDEVFYEWEYENPNSFEFEKGNRIVRGEEAKESFENMLSKFDLSETTIDDEVVSLLEQEGLSHINRIVIHRLDFDNGYKTWLWNKKE
ncbi:hypothetical protein [Evansella tamaricis]|uniref:Uncharacterized protein n=1 Tax=Evansella tamaricis TaxID=2069301 RepID=A0ABS6JHD9_9BACI|nr:hypothetical protein [Evansella tamaricis]MBU9712938.1 hypothetical protein [Evansella tamaricis]